MKIKSLTLENFRGFSNLSLDFSLDEPNVIIGVNGAGKSSILDCISVFLVRLVSMITYIDRFIGNHPDIGNRIHTYFSITDIKIGCEKTGAKLLFIEDDQESEVSLIANLEGSITNGKFLGDETMSNLASSIKNQLENNSQLNLPLFVYYPTNRITRTKYLDYQSEYINRHEQMFAYERGFLDGEVDFNQFFKWFKDQEDIENEFRLNDNLEHRDRKLEAVRKAIYSLLEGFSNLRIRRSRSPLQMTVKKQNQELVISQLSDGEKCLLAMIGDLARRLAIANPGLEDPLHGSGIVLIDEIELHLHPQWQRKIVPRLQATFPNCQFIITTHSPQVISGVKYVTLLNATPEGISAKKIPSYGKDSNRILEAIMDTPERDEKNQQDFRQLFHLIDEGDLNAAQELQELIEENMGDEDPLFVRAEWLIRRKQILAEEAARDS